MRAVVSGTVLEVEPPRDGSDYANVSIYTGGSDVQRCYFRVAEYSFTPGQRVTATLNLAAKVSKGGKPYLSAGVVAVTEA